jgi:hypothetical protein
MLTITSLSDRNPTHYGHSDVTKLVPQILSGVETNQGGHEESNQFDAAHTPDTQSSHEQPEEPLRLKAVAPLIVKLGPAEDGGYGATEEHRVEEDESADGGVRVFAEDHERH